MSKANWARHCLGALAILAVAWPVAGAAGHGLAAPSIVSFTPTHGLVGARVTIYGHNLQNVQTVQFNGVTTTTQPVANTTGTRIVVQVPPETNTGPGTITITTPGGTVTSTATFVVQPAGGATAKVRTAGTGGRPVIRSISPTHAKAGTKVTISGLNLRGALWVRFAGTKAVFTVPATDKVVAVVPRGAHSGSISVGTSRGSVSFKGFVVTGAGT